MSSLETLKKSKTTVILFWYESSIFIDDDPIDQFEVFDSLKDSFHDKIRIIKIDTFKTINSELAKSEKIRRLPFIQIYSNGLRLYETQGFLSEKKLIDIILDSYAHTHDNELD